MHADDAGTVLPFAGVPLDCRLLCALKPEGTAGKTHSDGQEEVGIG